MGGALCVFISVSLYVVAIVAAFEYRCPTYRGVELGGLDKPISTWPPGTQCWEESRAQGERRYIAEPFAGALKWPILAFALGAPICVLAGVGASIRDQRTQKAPAPKPSGTSGNQA